jgi:hypothetical protein
VECPVQAVEELSPEDPREDPNRHQEPRAASDPPVARQSQATAGDDAVEVGMKGEGLRPGVQHGNGAGQGSQPTSTNVMKRLDGRREEERVTASAVREEERMQSRGDRENQVEVLHGEEAARLGLHPPGLLEALALGAVTVATGVVQRDLAGAVVAHLEVAAQKRRPARHDVSDHPAAV